VLDHLQHIQPGFAAGRRGRGLLRRFKVTIHAVDSTVLELAVNCMDWAQCRRRKAAAKMRLRLDLRSFPPSFAIVDTAGQHENRRARELGAGLSAGEIAIFEKAYADLLRLERTEEQGARWATRAKDNLAWRVRKTLARGKENILKDQRIKLRGKRQGLLLRRIEAWVQIAGQRRRMVFITNNLQ